MKSVFKESNSKDKEVKTGTKKSDKWQKASVAGFVIALGIVYGDIGTSPLYVMQSVVSGQGGGRYINQEFVVGVLSLVIWTLTLLTTIKYVYIALNADNHKEGGIFSLFALVRRMKKWLIGIAIFGGAMLLANGTLTPAITVTSAVEGLHGVPSFVHAFGSSQNVIVVITLCILAFLFIIQRFGTNVIGRFFGPFMLVWFGFLGVAGLANAMGNLAIFEAINPWYAIHFLVSADNRAGLFILGSIFLSATGAEALYSDLGHVGKHNIRVSWPFVKICLILNYAGQAAWLLKQPASYGNTSNFNPFYDMLPKSITIYAIILATIAAIIASQALISGSFTLVSEAIRLKFLPMLRIFYPGAQRGQLYIPAVNFSLWLASSLIVIMFRTSSNMEAAYGLAVTLTMLTTTILLSYYLIRAGVKPWLSRVLMSVFGLIEFLFFLASAVKFIHGGYIVIVLGAILIFVMFVWVAGSKIVAKYVKRLDLKDYIDQLKNLKDDSTYDLYQTNVVYLTDRRKGSQLDMSILYSILDKRPKRAQVYWFVTVVVTDQPYKQEYDVDMMGTDFIVMVTLYLGFREKQTVPRYLRTIVRDLMDSGKLPQQHQRYSISKGRDVGDFGFILIEEHLNSSTVLTAFERFILLTKLSIKKVTTSPARWFGLQFSEATIEKVPLVVKDMKSLNIKPRNITQ